MASWYFGHSWCGWPVPRSSSLSRAYNTKRAGRCALSCPAHRLEPLVKLLLIFLSNLGGFSAYDWAFVGFFVFVYFPLCFGVVVAGINSTLRRHVTVTLSHVFVRPFCQLPRISRPLPFLGGGDGGLASSIVQPYRLFEGGGCGESHTNVEGGGWVRITEFG